MKKYDYIDLMKMIGMFLVIAAHCTLFFSGNQFWLIRAEQENAVLRWLSGFFVAASVPIFVFSAGFLMPISLLKLNSNISILNLIEKKAVRLLVPYYIYGALWLVPTYTLFDIPSYGRAESASLLNGYIEMALGRFSDVAWFLMMLFWVTLIWLLLYRLLMRDRLIYGAAAAFVLYLAAHFLLNQADLFKLSQIDVYIIVFYLGAAFFYMSDKINEHASPGFLVFGSLAGIAGCLCLIQLSNRYYLSELVVKTVSPVLFMTLSMGLCKTDIIRYLESTAIYKWLRNNSFYLYLLQMPGVYIIFRLIHPLLGSNSVLCCIMLFILTVLSDILVTFAFTRLRLLFSQVARG